MRAHALMPITSPIFARSSTAMAPPRLQGGPIIPISSSGPAHVAAALAALPPFGMMVLIMRRDTRLHRTMGMGYAMAMVAVNGTVLTIYGLSNWADLVS